MAAHEASLSMYGRAWAQQPEYLEARLKYLAVADKATRTVVILTERLDNHRNKGKQQIIVQHTTTVKANQAVVTDNIMTGKSKEAVASPVAPHISAFGPKRTSQVAPHMSAFGGKADMAYCSANVRL
jgi:hypothetical protein